MKLLAIVLAAIAATSVLTPATASAGPGCGERTRVTYDRCGTPVFWVYRYVGRDCHGCPVHRWVVVSRGHRHGHGGGYHDSGYRHDHGYGYGRGRGHGGYSRGGFSIRWSN